MINLNIIQNDMKDYDEDIWSSMKSRSKKYIEQFKEKSKCKMVIDEKKYILVCPTGDSHFGSDGTDYTLAEKDAKLIGNCDHAIAFGAGDTIDNFITGKILDAIINSSTTPKQQIKLLQQYLNFFNGKYILSISGNHENWSKKRTGVDWLNEFMEKNRIAFNQDEMRIYINLNGINYSGKLRHKVKYKSVYNKTHGLKQNQRLQSDEIFDFFISAHVHDAAVEITNNFGRSQLYLQTSSYKIVDPYSYELGYGFTQFNFPCFILNPFKKEMIPFYNLETGIQVVELLNKK